MGLVPVGKLVVLLHPVYNGGFIAPVLKFGHGFFMGIRVPVSPHVGFILPKGHGPERTVAVHQGFSFDEFGVPHQLFGAGNRMPEKGKEEKGRAEAQAGDGDEDHG